MARVLLTGASGLVGRHVLERLLRDERVERVVAPVRRPLAAHGRLLSPVVDFEALPEAADWWRVDAAISTLGTTIRAAGSQDAFRRVDHDYPLAVARWVRRHGASTFVLTSALGADVASRFFYSRVKGELERDLSTLGFSSLCFVRPGLIGGERQERRRGERLASRVLTRLGPLLPRAYRINPAERIAAAIVEAALAPRDGVQVVSSADLA